MASSNAYKILGNLNRGAYLNEKELAQVKAASEAGMRSLGIKDELKKENKKYRVTKKVLELARKVATGK